MTPREASLESTRHGLQLSIQGLHTEALQGKAQAHVHELLIHCGLANALIRPMNPSVAHVSSSN